MVKNYRKIEFEPGNNIDSAIKKLETYKVRNELVYGLFNGQELYSDIDDLDSAYKKITGLTKSEFDEREQLRHEEYQEKKRKHEEAIPELTKEWIEKGKSILDEKYRDKWNEIVPIRLKDLYRGFELQACLEIVQQLNNDFSFKEVEKTLEEQGHSGMSFGLVCAMVKAFSDRGGDFVEYVNKPKK